MQNYNLKFKIFLFTHSLFTFSFLFFNLSEANAQTLDPTLWQTQATGLKTQNNTDKKTAGLGFVVKQQDWPFFNLRGGVKDGTTWQKLMVSGPVGIELGQIKIPNSPGTFSTETADWAHNEMSFNSGQLKVWISRLTPAILTQTSSNALRLMAGNVNGNMFRTPPNPWESRIIAKTPAPSYFKYVAFPTGGNIQVSTLSSTPLTLSSMDQNWILIWYGNNSHFLDTKIPTMAYRNSWGPDAGWVNQTDAYLADAPILLVFQNNPATIVNSPEGGIDLSFSSQAGYISISPLLGREIPKASDMETWASSFPSSARTKAEWWATHLCDFPLTVDESYSYDSATDTTTITENITFISGACTGSIRFSPLPPFLGIAKDSLGIQFSGTIVDGNLPTEFGPSLGIESTTSYTWRISGLKKYTDSKRVLANGQVPTEVTQKLTSQIDKLFDTNGNPIHFRPWIFMDAVPVHASRGDLYWVNPADTIYQLTEVANSLTDGDSTKTKLINYIKSERNSYKPEDIYDLNLSQGTIRPGFSAYWSDWDYSWNTANRYLRLKRVPLYNFFTLAKYYELTGETLPQGTGSTWEKAKNTLSLDMKEQDWATNYWFKGFEERPIPAVINSNRHFAGLLGFINLANKSSDQQSEFLGRSLLAKALVLRTALAQYPRYLYSANLVELPKNTSGQPIADWQPKYLAGSWLGHLFNYNWTGAYDDPRQVITLNQFEIFLFEHSVNDWASPNLVSYRDMIPELFRALNDYSKQDIEIYLNKVKALFPHWYMVFSEGILGGEHSLSHPIDSFQTFMANIFIQGESPQNIARQSNIPSLETGDIFYLQKLGEVVKAYKGWSWNDVQSTCTLVGDIDCSNSVNVVDLSLLISKFGGVDSTADLDDSGKVNVIDLSILLSNFGR